MTTIAISMCKDEADIIESTVTHMASQVDRIIIADNGSTDGTRKILDRLSRDLPLTVNDDPEVGYFQSRKMSALAAEAAALGADWVLPFDSDEIHYSPFGRIGDVLADQASAIATAALFDHVPSAIDNGDPDPVSRIGWRRRDPAPLHKVACRPALPVTIEQGNHSAGYRTDEVAGLLVVRHFPIRSADQMIRKARNGGAAYAATNLPDHIGAHWRQWSKLSDDELADVFLTYYFAQAPEEDASLIFDPSPASSHGVPAAQTAGVPGAT